MKHTENMDQSKSQSSQIKTHDPNKQEEVLCGEVISNVFYRHVGPEHYMRKIKGYGIQDEAFHQIENVDTILIIQKDTGEVFSSTPQTWKEKGKVMDFGHGKQVFLSTSHMKKDK